MSGYAMTVEGPVEVESLGFTLPHEHILFDLAGAYFIESDDLRKREISELPVSMDILWELNRDPCINRDNLIFRDEELALTELGRYQEAGGRTIVDVTPPELARDPEALRRLARRTGLNIIAGTGHYLQSVHPPELATETVDEIAQRMISEISDGIGGLDIRPGIIGEIGLSNGIHPDEHKVLEATAAAHVETGLAISIHCPLPYEKLGLEILEILGQGGVQPDRVILGHMSHTIADRAYHRAIAEAGATLAYDRFGAEFYYESWNRYREPRDADVVDAVVDLVGNGYSDRILLSHDVAYKISLSSYGGCGYSHIPNHIVMYLRDRGVSAEDIDQMTIRTPARLLKIEGLEKLAAA